MLNTVTNGGYTVYAGHNIEVYWDDTASTFVVYDYVDDTLTSPTTLTAGPDIGSENVDFKITYGYSRGRAINYSYCDGPNLAYFRKQTTFPYVHKSLIYNAGSCAIVPVVCDLNLTINSIVDATDFLASDGTVILSASSSNGIIKYSLNPDFDYATEGQLSGTFIGLLPGTYTAVTKDGSGCFDTQQVVIGYPIFYNTKFRFEYIDLNNVRSRIDILERGYTGDIIKCKVGGTPFVLSYRGEGNTNKFDPIIPSQAILSAISETNLFFRELFTQDDRKYQLRYYKYNDQFIGGFIPATLDALNLWTNIADPSFTTVMPYKQQWSWNIGVAPTVNFGDGSSNYARTFDTQSKFYHTNYAFEAGKSYSFGYTLEGITSPIGYSPANSIFKIKIVDASNNTLIESVLSYTGSALNGTYDFIAPSNAAGIIIAVYVSSAGSQHSYRITSFTNLTGTESSSQIGFELKWIGYVISDNYQEQYLATPYEVQITATDGLADLVNFDFVDSSGNLLKDDVSVLNILFEVLKKTDLGIDLVSAINRFEVGMNNSSDSFDPLNQCFVDVSIFYDGDKVSSCQDVIKKILSPFGARLVQRLAKWHIVSIEQQVSSYGFRRFDLTGQLKEVGEIDNIVNIEFPLVKNRAALIERNQVLEVVPSWGNFFFKYNLIKNPSLIKSYSFELDDVIINNGIVSFKNWTANLLYAPGAEIGIKQTKAFEGKSSFYYKPLFNNADYDPPLYGDIYGVKKNELTLTAKSGVIEYTGVDAFELKFTYSISLLGHGTIPTGPGSIRNIGTNPKWVKIKWMLKVGSKYFFNGIWTDDSLFKYNEIYVSEFGSVKDFKVVAPFDSIVDTVTENFYFEFVLETQATVSAIDLSSASFANFKNITTDEKPEGYLAKSYTTEDALPLYTRCKVYYWQLIREFDVQTGDTTIYPTDFDSSTNAKVWKLEEVRVTGGQPPPLPLFEENPQKESIVNYIYIDNVVLLHYPNGEEQVTDITLLKFNNSNIKRDFDGDYYLNDIDIDNINNSERTYKNYFKLANGTPTQEWSRVYRPGNGKILELLADDFLNQYKTQSNKLTGKMYTDTPIEFSTILNEANDGNRKYMFMGYEFDDKMCSIGFDIIELKDVVTDDTSESIDAGFTSGFSLGLRS